MNRLEYLNNKLQLLKEELKEKEILYLQLKDEILKREIALYNLRKTIIDIETCEKDWLLERWNEGKGEK